MQILLGIIDKIILSAIVILPFSIAISLAPMNIFMGFIVVFYFLKKILQLKPPFVKTALNIPLGLFFIVTCVSLVHSVNYFDSLKGGIFRLFLYALVFLIIAETLRDKKQFGFILVSICLGLVLISVDGLWQVTGHKDFIRGYQPILNIGLLRATASFADSNLMGIYLSALSPLVLGLSLFHYKGRLKVVMLLVGLFLLAGIAFTYSRPSLLAIYLVFLFFALVKKNKWMIVLLLVAALLSLFLLPKTVKNWAKEVEYNPLRFMCNDDRIAVYLNSLRMIKDHPFIGVGANTYMKNYKRYKQFPQYRNVGTLDYMYAHSIYLHMAVEVGLFGLAVFFWLLFRLFKRGAFVYRGLSDPFLKTLALSLMGCLIAFLVNGLTESSLYYARVAILFWYLVGLILALDNFLKPAAPRVCTGGGINERA